MLEAAIPRLLKYPTPPFAFQRQLEATYTLKTFDRLPQIKAPTLVVTGAEDVLIPAKNSEIIASQIPGAKLHIIPGVGHGFMSDGKAGFLKVFLPFVKSHPMAPIALGFAPAQPPFGTRVRSRAGIPRAAATRENDTKEVLTGP